MEGKIYTNLSTGELVKYLRRVITVSERPNVLPLREVELTNLMKDGSEVIPFLIKEDEFLRIYRPEQNI